MTAYHPNEASAMKRLRASLKACSYGPFGYFQAALVGFVLGGIAFLAADAAFARSPGQLDVLPILVACACGASMLLVLLGFAANYLIGRHIRDELELQRAIFGSGTLPPPQPRPDVPGFDLRPDRGASATAERAPLPPQREVETA